jgi:hypothetical protein
MRGRSHECLHKQGDAADAYACACGGWEGGVSGHAVIVGFIEGRDAASASVWRSCECVGGAIWSD